MLAINPHLWPTSNRRDWQLYARNVAFEVPEEKSLPLRELQKRRH
jgi:hypothetical protein